MCPYYSKMVRRSQFIIILGFLLAILLLLFTQKVQVESNFVYDLNLVKYYTYDLYLQAKKALNNSTAFNNLETNISKFCNEKMLNCTLNATYLTVESDSKLYIVKIQ